MKESALPWPGAGGKLARWRGGGDATTPTDTEVLKTERLELRGIVLVAPVKYDRRLQFLPHDCEVGIPELLPFGYQQQRVGTVKRLIGVVAERKLAALQPCRRDALSHVLDGNRIVGPHLRACL